MAIKPIYFNCLQRVLFCTALAWGLIHNLGVRTVAIGTLALLMSLLWSGGDRAQGQQLRLPGVAFQPQSGKPTFRSGVELVRITAVVQDRRGRPVLGLLPSDFELDVSGEPVQIVEFGSEASGVSLALLIDDSGSMSLAGRRDAAQEVAKQIVAWLEAGRDEVTLLGFDKHLRTVQPFTTQPVDGAGRPRGASSPTASRRSTTPLPRRPDRWPSAPARGARWWSSPTAWTRRAC